MASASRVSQQLNTGCCLTASASREPNLSEQSARRSAPPLKTRWLAANQNALFASLSAPQALCVGVASPAGQFCREASAGDASAVFLQPGGAGEDPADDPEAEQPAAARPT